MSTVIRDVRYAIRQLRRSPGFTLTALTTLAIGIGANTAIFTLVHAVLLKSLPVAHAGALYKLGDRYTCCTQEKLQGNWSLFAYPFYREIRDQATGFEELAATEAMRPELSVRRGGGAGAAEPFTGEFVSGNYFSTLGVQAAAGRMFDAADDRAGAGPVAVASHLAWQKLGLDPSIVGRALTINGVSVTLVGVTPPGFFGDRLESRPADFWMPMSLEPAFTRESTLLETPDAGWLYIIGRLRPDAEPARVQAQLTASLRTYLRVPGHVNAAEEPGKIDSQIVRLAPAAGGINAMKDTYQQGLYLLLAVSAAVLLIACANLANLLLARGAAQRVRTAVELAMGASRREILRRHMTESVVLSLAGGAVGLATAVYASRAILLLAFRGAPDVPIATAPSTAVLLFTFGVSLATGLLFGAGPAWLASRANPADALRGSSRVVADAARPQRSLVVLQAALSLALVTVAGLLTESLGNLDRQALGFETSGRLIVEIDPQSAGYTQASIDALYRRLDDRLSGVPGVASASLALFTPQASSTWGARIYTEGGRGPWLASWNRVGARYFETIGTPIVRGRALDAHDTAAARRVAVINETFASRYFPGQNAIGRRFGKYEVGHATDFEVVGVVKDARYQEASLEVRPMFFVPLEQTVTYTLPISNKIEESSRYITTIALHVNGDPDRLAPAVRQALAAVDPNLPPTSLTSLPEIVRIATRQRTLVARLSDAFGAIALLLAAVGLYGVTAYRVTRRTSEIGLRMALGATRGDIASMVVRGAVSQTALGLLAGIPIALLGARALQHQLFGVSPFNLRALALAGATVLGCALLAAALPARRATAIAPMDALRAE
ncbi:MAG TPA: ABC transporter permease [Vicinamibacterales bacterium]|nr:ABC transporter permease [Vicinamibacterales bacterium]